MTLAVVSLGFGLGTAVLGLQERLVAFLTVAWPLVTALGTWWWAGHRIGSRRVRHVLAVVGLTVACGVAGVSATAVAPVTAETRHYQSSVSLDPNPARAGQLVAETAFGDIEVGFTGLAPASTPCPR